MVEIPIQLTHINGRVESAKILNFTPITVGTQQGKEFIDLERESIPGISHMVKRRVEYAPLYRGNKTSSQHYMDLWESLKDANIPTLDEVASISENEVAETDITADGSKIYGKDTHNNDIVPSPIDAIFKNIDLDIVLKEARRIALLAADQQIMLSQDHCLDLVIRPNGEWIVMARDIKHVFTNVQYPVDGLNIDNAEWFVNGHLRATQDKIN